MHDCPAWSSDVVRYDANIIHQLTIQMLIEKHFNPRCTVNKQGNKYVDLQAASGGKPRTCGIVDRSFEKTSMRMTQDVQRTVQDTKNKGLSQYPQGRPDPGGGRAYRSRPEHASLRSVGATIQRISQSFFL